MCTALTLKTKDLYFGRNLDLDISFSEEICVMPRNYPLEFRKTGKMFKHYALIGMAAVIGEIPLYYDAVNEYGLCMAGLNFPNNAYYSPVTEDKDNVCSFEFIPWILCQCKSLNEARELLSKINICDIPFSENVPTSPLHWIIADKEGAVVVEAMKDGLHIHENPLGVLTNNPPFEYHLENLKNYISLTADNGGRTISPQDYCMGNGALGLPGDLTSKSRFVRAYFGKRNSKCAEDEASSVSQVFHLMASVAMIKGNCITDKNTIDYTVYSSCINADKGIYYYTSYDNAQIHCVDMHRENLGGITINRFPLVLRQNIQEQN